MGETLVAQQNRAAPDIRHQGDPPYTHSPRARKRVPIGLTGVRVRIARSDEDRQKAYRLRYQVYCIKNHFEPASRHANGQETDLHDAQSVHGLALYADTGDVAGTARLILPAEKSGGLPLPTPQICAPEVIAAHAHKIPARSTAELSRFAISKHERRRHGKTSPGDPNRIVTASESVQLVSTISLGLMRATIAMARSDEITHLYALIEPALLRMLRGMSIHFEKLGPVVNYHGRRQPCYCHIDDLLHQTFLERPDIWAVITDDGRLWSRRSATVVDLTRLAAGDRTPTPEYRIS